MKEAIEKSKELIDKSNTAARIELEKMKIELEAKSQLFATSIGLISPQRYDSI
ncbi:hypothetical protein NRIC_05710 [Enterococcus florum]|uniref:Uncharacterized protein n=1 Tax=Enterococcus florum TaxID=2480627 RepID=A0A4P5P4T9_9ENTE|nr:hypothetical protein [Enterococcus florum]GCF92680.1 hypothetical protein NRIC_05710 [Enterococcus florum]